MELGVLDWALAGEYGGGAGRLWDIFLFFFGGGGGAVDIFLFWGVGGVGRSIGWVILENFSFGDVPRGKGGGDV